MTIDAIAAQIKNAYYEGRDNGGTMHTCADDAARRVADLIDAESLPIWEKAKAKAIEADGLREQLDKVRALYDEWMLRTREHCSDDAELILYDIRTVLDGEGGE